MAEMSEITPELYELVFLPRRPVPRSEQKSERKVVKSEHKSEQKVINSGRKVSQVAPILNVPRLRGHTRGPVATLGEA